MADLAPVAADFDCACFVAVVRYFDGETAGAVGPVPVPRPLCVSCDDRSTAVPDASALPTFAAWRSPTESLFVTAQRAMADQLAVQWSGRTDGCCVPQSDGICIMRLRGAQSAIAHLLRRLAAPTAMPARGEARTSRIADLMVTAVCVRDGEVLLAVDRVHAGHLRAWLESTLADD